MTMNYNFQKDMKAIREILGMTQEEFAEKIGVEQATISRNELGFWMWLLHRIKL